MPITWSQSKNGAVTASGQGGQAGPVAPGSQPWTPGAGGFGPPGSGAGGTTADRLRRAAQQRQQRQAPAPAPQPQGSAAGAGYHPGQNPAPGPAPQQGPQPNQPPPLTQQELLQAFNRAKQGGYLDQWFQNPQVQASLEQHNAYYAPNRPDPNAQRYIQAGMSAPGAVGQSYLTAGQNVNWDAIYAYQNNPAVRDQMNALGLVPTVNGVPMGANGQAPRFTPASMPASTPQGIRGFGQQGYSVQPAPQIPTPSGAGYGGAAAGYGGSPSYGAGGGGATGPQGPYGLSQAAGARLAGSISGGLEADISGQGPGLPVNAIAGQEQDAIARAARERVDAINADFARRGQQGTPAHQQAVQEAMQGARLAAASSRRDIGIEAERDRLAARRAALGTGSSFLRSQQDAGSDLQRLLLGAAGLV